MILQWAMILVLSLLVLSLMRQLGERALPASTEKNPDEIFNPFSEIPEYSVTLMNGGKFNLGGASQNLPCLIIFFSPKCGACEELPGAILEFVKKYPLSKFQLLAVLKRADRKSAEEFVTEKSLAAIPLALEEDFPADLNPGGAPFAAALATGGKVAARGKPKTLTHLLEMANAAQNMAEMAPDHSRRTHEWGESAPYWMPEQIGAQPSQLPSEPVSTEARV